MASGTDDQLDPRFASLGEAGIVELCSSLADYGEAGGLSRDLMLQVGRFAEARYGRNLEVLLAVSRMYLLGEETVRAKAALLRAGKLWPEEARVKPLLSHTLKLLDDTRSVEQAIREAPALPPLHATPPPMSAVDAAALALERRRRPPQMTPPGLPMVKLMPRARPGTPAVPKAPGMPRGVEGAIGPRAITSRVVRPVVAADGRAQGASPASPGAARAPLSASKAETPPDLRTEVSKRIASETPTTPPAAPRAANGGGSARAARIRLLDPEDERRHLDPYELIGEIASGGMATVFLARLAGAGGFQRFVAIKRLHPHLAREEEFIEMFLDEARIAAGIHNPHVVPILEVGTSDQGYFLVMELVEGDTLSGLVTRSLRRGAMLPPPVALRIVVDALTGLHAAHQLHDADGRPLGLVHRDCSPQNVLVGVDGSARITDFGVARAASRMAFTRPQQVKGKVAYLSPEQAHAQEVDRRSDIFTMGIVLWEVLAGRPLFQGDTEAATLSRLIGGPIPSVRSFAPDLPAAIDEVCRHALQRDPARRFRTAAEMAEALERAATAEGSVGIASPRELGRFVEGLMGAEIASQRDVVRAWIAQSDAAPARPPAGDRAQRPISSMRPTSPATPRSGGRTPREKAEKPAEESEAAPVEAAQAPAPRPVETPVAAGAALEETAAPEETEATPGESLAVEPIAPAPAPSPRRMPPLLSRLLAVKMKTRTGMALVAVLVVLATSPLVLKAVRSRSSLGRAPAGARGPRSKGAARPAPTGWDDGEWTPPDGGPDEK